jgi:hypothetical protein
VSSPDCIGQNHNVKVTNTSFENVAKSRYLGTVETNKNYELIEFREYFLLFNLKSFVSLSLIKNLKIKT